MKAILLAVFASLALSATANATIPGTCAMKFEVKIVDRFLSLKYTGAGHGKVYCTSLDGREYSSPIKISMVGYGPGVGSYTLVGVSGDINVASANDFNGTFVGAAAQAVGANFQIGLTGKKTGLKFGVDVAVNKAGIGIFAGGTEWKIRVMN